MGKAVGRGGGGCRKGFDRRKILLLGITILLFRDKWVVKKGYVMSYGSYYCNGLNKDS